MGSLAANPKRVALITGAAQGIGRCIAIRLAEDGLDVALNDLPSKLAELEEVAVQIKTLTGNQAIAVVGDVSKEEDVQSMVASTVEHLGGLDVVGRAHELDDVVPLTLTRIATDGRECGNHGVPPACKLCVRQRQDWPLYSRVLVTVEDWDKNMAINARGVMLCYKHAAKQMIEQGRGGRLIGASAMSDEKVIDIESFLARCLLAGWETR